MVSTKAVIITFALAVAAVLGAVLTSGRSAGPGGGEVGSAMIAAAQLRIEDVERIVLSKRSGERYVFERTAPAAWMQVEPFAYPMDAMAMRGLASAALQVMVVDRLEPAQFDDELTHATLGLEPAEAVTTFETAGNQLQIALGRRGIAGRAYAMLGEEKNVLVVSQELHERAVEMNPKEWRDRRLFRNVSVDCDRIVREDGATRLVIERDRRTWRMLEPAQTRVDREAMERFLQALGGARSAGFISDQPAGDSLRRFGLAPGTSAASIAITCSAAQVAGDSVERNEHTQRLHIGNPAGAGTQDRFGIVDGRPTVVRVPLETLQGLFVNPDNLIDPTGSGVVPADVKSIQIVNGEQVLRLERDLDRWIVPAMSSQEVPAARVNELLSQLTQLRGSAVERREYPRELERAVVTFYGFDDRPMDTVRVLHHQESGQWALENGDNVLRVFQKGFELALTAEALGISVRE